MFKCIQFAYPTSPYAEEHGYGRKGCYSVHVITAGCTDLQEQIGPFATWQEAHDRAAQIEMPFHPYSIKKSA